MADLVLSDGREVTIDLSRITHREYVGFWAKTMPEEERDAILLKLTGYSAEEIENLPEPDWRRFKAKLEEVSFKPVEEVAKNSPSAST